MSPTRIATGPRKHPVKGRFDTDSFRIAIDNCASYCMTNNKQHFIGKPRRTLQMIDGLGKQTAKLIGTVRWNIADDTGRTHAFEIPNVLYVPDLPFALLSPQHWAQSLQHRAYCVTDKTTVTLHWNNEANTKTIPLNNTANVGMFRSAPAYTNYTAFLAQCKAPHNSFQGLQCFISNTEGNEGDSHTGTVTSTTTIFDTGGNEGARHTGTAPNTTTIFDTGGDEGASNTGAAPNTTIISDTGGDEGQQHRGCNNTTIISDTGGDEGASNTGAAPPLSTDMNPGTDSSDTTFHDEAVMEPTTGPERPLDNDQAELLRWHIQTWAMYHFESYT